MVTVSHTKETVRIVLGTTGPLFGNQGGCQIYDRRPSPNLSFYVLPHYECKHKKKAVLLRFVYMGTGAAQRHEAVHNLRK